MEKEEMEEKLIVGARVKLGAKYCALMRDRFHPGQIITLIKGIFENENGLYCEYVECPAIWDDVGKEFDSIYHLFGNDFEFFYDNEILNP